jgi:hypothetical protein
MREHQVHATELHGMCPGVDYYCVENRYREGTEKNFLGRRGEISVRTSAGLWNYSKDERC